MSTLGLNSTALTTLANEMRLMNEKPDMLMPHAEYMAASGIYAMISGLESLAQGLKAEEQRQAKLAEEAYQREIEWLRTFRSSQFGYTQPDLIEGELDVDAYTESEIAIFKGEK